MPRSGGSWLAPAILALGVFVAAGCAKTPQQRARQDLEVIRRESTPERLQARGDAAAMSGDLTRAEQYFVAALKAGGDERVLIKRLLVVCIGDNRYPAAATYGEDYLHKHPADIDIRYALSTIYVGLGDLTRARDGLRVVVDARPDIADAHYALASVLRDTGESLLDADKQFREYIRLSPNGEYAEAARASLLKSVPMIPKEVFEETLLQFFAPIRPYLDDASVSEIMINGPDQIFVERRGQLELVPAKFASREALLAALRNLSQYVGKHIDEAHPILEGRLPDGSRVEALIPPVAPDGPCIAIRRFFKETLTVDRLVGFGSLTGVAAASLQAMVISKLNIMIAGGTGSGKTSMLNALSGFIPDGERVVVIEDSREVQFQKPHVVQLEARPADPKGKGAVSIRDLFRATLRMRPDRVVVGEIRGGEALDIVQAMTSGHGGCMGTLHATHPKDTLTRLETMCMMSDVDMPLPAMRQQIGSGVQLVVQVSRLQDGSRKVTHITEVMGFDLESQRYLLQDIFVRDYRGFDDEGRIVSDLVPTGILPACLPQLHEHGVNLPDPVLEMASLRQSGGTGASNHGR